MSDSKGGWEWFWPCLAGSFAYHAFKDATVAEAAQAIVVTALSMLTVFCLLWLSRHIVVGWRK